VREPDPPQAPLADNTEQAQAVAPRQAVQRILVETPLPAAPFPEFSGVPQNFADSAVPSRDRAEPASGTAPALRRIALADVPGGAPFAAWRPDDSAGETFAQGGVEPAWAGGPAPAQLGSAPGFPQARPAAEGPAAPQAQAREAGPQGGDVILDGMKVGRWMSRLLDREAGRASAGPTGFDARRGQLLPGVTVGG
jgi:hypothetical protein